LSFQSENKKSILVLGQTIRVNHYVMRHMVSNVQKLKSSKLH
jgi:ribosomal protein S6